MLNQVQHDEDDRLRWVSGSDRRQPKARNGPENRRAATLMVVSTGRRRGRRFRSPGLRRS